MKEDESQFPNVTHYTKVDVQPGGINIQNVEHLHQTDILKALGVDIASLVRESIKSESEESKDKPNTFTLSSQDQALLKRIHEYLEKGDWQSPATAENVKQFFSTLFGAETGMLDDEDLEKTKEFRDFFKKGRAGGETDRVEVSLANIVGYLNSCQLLAGGPSKLSMDIFGSDEHVNNINKGKNGDGNSAFRSLIPLLEKYRERIIG